MNLLKYTLEPLGRYLRWFILQCVPSRLEGLFSGHKDQDVKLKVKTYRYNHNDRYDWAIISV